MPGPGAGHPLEGSRDHRAPLPRGQRIPSEVVDAEATARAIVTAAETDAMRIREAAAAGAAAVAAEAAAAARARALAELAAQEVALRIREERLEQTGLERAVALARVLAERLLGEAIRLDPTCVAALAREALREASGARRVLILAHPADAPFLTNALADLGAGSRVVEVLVDAALDRGSLRVRTDVGELDAALGVELDRLVDHLRELVPT
ncbi:MAG: hypothetical protein JW751_14805 [Polyangiaceae bacterium]|nr:hypothetical protein [Polyangiaceae bacterium]